MAPAISTQLVGACSENWELAVATNDASLPILSYLSFYELGKVRMCCVLSDNSVVNINYGDHFDSFLEEESGLWLFNYISRQRSSERDTSKSISSFTRRLEIISATSVKLICSGLVSSFNRVVLGSSEQSYLSIKESSLRKGFKRFLSHHNVQSTWPTFLSQTYTPRAAEPPSIYASSCVQGHVEPGTRPTRPTYIHEDMTRHSQLIET